MGAVSGAFAAAATTPLDVIKTHMMCTAASRPSMLSSSRIVWQVSASNLPVVQKCAKDRMNTPSSQNQVSATPGVLV